MKVTKSLVLVQVEFYQRLEDRAARRGFFVIA
jgi:hypothetical protein